MQLHCNTASVMTAVCDFTEMKWYCSTLLPYASEQPAKTEQLPAAIFEANALYCARAHSTEIEWSRQAAAAQRSRQVGVFIVNDFSSNQFVFIDTG